MLNQELHPSHWKRIIEKAISSIPEAYYGGCDEGWIADKIPEAHSEDWKATLSQYNERDWCYELYHQLRNALQDDDLFAGISDDKVRLSGESSKSSTYHAINDGCPWSRNPRCRIPDILLHDPLGIGNQIFAIEVKRHGRSGTSFKALADDLIALTEYTDGLQFQLGFFVGLGIDHDDFCRDLHEFWAAMNTPERRVMLDRVCCKVYVCLVNDNRCPPSSRSRHPGFKLLRDFPLHQEGEETG